MKWPGWQMAFYVYAYKRETESHKSKHGKHLSAMEQNEMGETWMSPGILLIKMTAWTEEKEVRQRQTWVA